MSAIVTTMIKVVLFDFYGVFVPDSYGQWLEENGLKREGDFARLINDLDKAAITESEFLRQLSILIGRRVQPGEIGNAEPKANLEVVELLRELQQQYTIGLFSNASKKLRMKLETLDLTNLFDHIIISSEIGHAKPSDEAFKTAIKLLNVEAGQILFIDDNSLNVIAADRNGIKAIQFITAENLRTYFIDQNIL